MVAVSQMLVKNGTLWEVSNPRTCRPYAVSTWLSAKAPGRFRSGALRLAMKRLQLPDHGIGGAEHAISSAASRKRPTFWPMILSVLMAWL